MATRSKWIVVRQDTLEGRKVDGTWGDQLQAREYTSKPLAMNVAAKVADEIGRMVGVQVSPATRLARSAS